MKKFNKIAINFIINMVLTPQKKTRTIQCATEKEQSKLNDLQTVCLK